MRSLPAFALLLLGGCPLADAPDPPARPETRRPDRPQTKEGSEGGPEVDSGRQPRCPE